MYGKLSKCRDLWSSQKTCLLLYLLDEQTKHFFPRIALYNVCVPVYMQTIIYFCIFFVIALPFVLLRFVLFFCFSLLA